MRLVKSYLRDFSVRPSSPAVYDAIVKSVCDEQMRQVSFLTGVSGVRRGET